MLKKNKELCPICNESIKKKSIKDFNLNDTIVTDSRATKKGSMIRRRRVCNCGSGGRFTTYERIHRAELTVIKRNGQITTFNKERLFQYVKIALNGCIDQDIKTEQISNEVNEKIKDIGKDTVPQLHTLRLRIIDPFFVARESVTMVSLRLKSLILFFLIDSLQIGHNSLFFFNIFYL